MTNMWTKFGFLLLLASFQCVTPSPTPSVEVAHTSPVSFGLVERSDENNDECISFQITASATDLTVNVQHCGKVCTGTIRIADCDGRKHTLGSCAEGMTTEVTYDKQYPPQIGLLVTDNVPILDAYQATDVIIMESTGVDAYSVDEVHYLPGCKGPGYSG